MMPSRFFVRRMACALLVLLAVVPRLAENIDPDGDGSQYAYGENVGWINARPLGAGGAGIEVTDTGLAGWMWSEAIGWISLSCENTASCATAAFGVANDGAGALSGYAWSENGGWISFSCVNTSSCGRAVYGVTIDPGTGDFSGRAWGENIGWVTFADTGAVTYKVKTGWTACASMGSPVARADGNALQWDEVPAATTYDVVRGGIGSLRDNAGDFTVSVDLCVVNNTPDRFAALIGEPTPGNGFWYLVRTANCGGGSYDTGLPSQVAPRDDRIEASGNQCP